MATVVVPRFGGGSARRPFPFFLSRTDWVELARAWRKSAVDEASAKTVQKSGKRSDEPRTHPFIGRSGHTKTMPVSTELIMAEGWVRAAERIMRYLYRHCTIPLLGPFAKCRSESVKRRVHSRLFPRVRNSLIVRMSGCLDRHEDKGYQQKPGKAQHDFRNSHIFVTSPHSVGLGYFYSAPSSARTSRRRWDSTVIRVSKLSTLITSQLVPRWASVVGPSPPSSFSETSWDRVAGPDGGCTA